MVFHEIPLGGAFLVDLERIEDARGFFARVWCAQELADQGLSPVTAQVNVGYNRRRGTLRGLHFQRPPHQEVKLVRCTRGAVYDVIVDLRPASPTHRRWFGIELSADNHRMLYAPEGFAHGYVSLTDHAEILYHASRPYAPDSATGVRYDDPALAITWPIPVEVISDADRSWPDYVG